MMKSIFFGLMTALALAGCATPSPQAEQFAKEQRACAELGLAPGEGAFSGCVADLDATMFGLSAVASN
jgi:hypothetical protein